MIRMARTSERQTLEALQWRASLANEADRETLPAHPDAIELPAVQIERGEVFVADENGHALGFAAFVGGELDGLFVEPELWGKASARRWSRLRSARRNARVCL